MGLIEQAAAGQAMQVEAVLAWLNANPGWLLILDNIDADPARDLRRRAAPTTSCWRTRLIARATLSVTGSA
jgi:hypothetical protein